MPQKLAIFALALLMPSTCCFAQQNRDQPMNDNGLVARHQRCVLQAFEQNLKNSRNFDPEILPESVRQCESELEPLKRKIIQQTGDRRFAESEAERIRQASKLGVIVALTGY